MANEGLVGVCGPRIKAEAVAADSVETRWEYGEEYKATDGDPRYWHSQYIDANNAKLPETDTARKWPHWIDLKMVRRHQIRSVRSVTRLAPLTVPRPRRRARAIESYLAGSLGGLKGQGDNRANRTGAACPRLAGERSPAGVDVPVVGNAPTSDSVVRMRRVTSRRPQGRHVRL